MNYAPSIAVPPSDGYGRRSRANADHSPTPTTPRRAQDARIALLDRQPDNAAVLGGYLESHGLAVVSAPYADTLRTLARREAIDAVIFDIKPQGEDLLALLRDLADLPGSPPIIVLSDSATDVDRIVALELGADDYLAKPVNPREVLARLRALLRRRGLTTAEAQESQVLTFSGWKLDPTLYTLRDPQGREVILTSGEFKLAHALASHAGHVITREELLHRVHGTENDAFDRAIDVAVSRLRAKLMRHGGGNLIRTVRGEGYLFAARV